MCIADIVLTNLSPSHSYISLGMPKHYTIPPIIREGVQVYRHTENGIGLV